MVIIFSIMRIIILYFIVSFTLISCKTERKKTQSVENILKIDTLKVNNKGKLNGSIKRKFIGKTLKSIKELEPFNHYSSGGMYFGESNGGLFTFRGKEDEIKFIIFTIKAKVVDIVDIENEFDSNMFNSNKETVIFYDVLQNNKRDPELFALAAFEEQEIITEVYRVWRANCNTERIEEIKDKTNIVVINEDW